MLIERMTEKYGAHLPPPSNQMSPQNKLPVHSLSNQGPMTDADKTQTSSQCDLANSGILKDYFEQRSKIMEVATSPIYQQNHTDRTYIDSTNAVTPNGDLNSFNYYQGGADSSQYDLQPAYFETLNSYGRQPEHFYQVRQPQMSHRVTMDVSPIRKSPYGDQLHTARRQKRESGCCSAEKLKVKHKRLSVEQTETQGRKMYERYKKIEQNLKVKRIERETELLREVKDKPSICKKSRQIIERGLAFSDYKQKRHSECYCGVQSPDKSDTPVYQIQQRTIEQRHQTPKVAKKSPMQSARKKTFTPRNHVNGINKQFSSLKKVNDAPAGRLKTLCELYKIPLQSNQTDTIEEIPVEKEQVRHQPVVKKKPRQVNRSTDPVRNSKAQLSTINENVHQSMQSVKSVKKQNKSSLFLPQNRKSLKVVKFVSAIPDNESQPVLKVKEYKPPSVQDYFQNMLRKQQPLAREVGIKINLDSSSCQQSTYERNILWKNQQERKISHERLKQQEKSFEECKFQPQIGQDPSKILSSNISPARSARQNKRYSDIHDQKNKQSHVKLPTHHANFSYCSSPNCSKSPDHSRKSQSDQNNISFLTSQNKSNIHQLASQYVQQQQMIQNAKSLFDISSMDFSHNESNISNKSPFLSQIQRGSIGHVQNSSQLDFTLNDDGSQTVTGGQQRVYFGGPQKNNQIYY